MERDTHNRAEWLKLINQELIDEIDKANTPLMGKYADDKVLFSDFINCLFTWTHTRQGYTFWRNIANEDPSKWMKANTLQVKIDEKALIRSYY